MNYLFPRISSLLLTTLLSLSLFVFPFHVNALVEEEAIFAGGCFWCLEHDLEDLDGVISAHSGYSGGDLSNPSYANHVGHQESVLVKFDPLKISYAQLLKEFWYNIDPFDGTGQFCDKGDSYRPVIFTNSEKQSRLADVSFDSAAQELNVQSDEIKVEITQSGKFWLAEQYHQDYAKNNQLKYNFYRYSCGRDKRLNEIWQGRNSP